jgi:putative hydrolase of the HAD superfamily
MSLAIKTIIFDLSEVLIAGLCGVEETLALRLGSPPPEVLSAFGGDLLVQLCRGEISEDVFLKSVIATNGWNISMDELKQSIRANFRRKVPGMENLLERLAAQYELVLLSDHAKEWVQHIHEIHPHLQIFRARIYSFEFGQTKNEPSTFQRLLELIHRRGDECVFVDDNLGNIECARSAGIQAFHFTNAETLLNDLRKESLLS